MRMSFHTVTLIFTPLTAAAHGIKEPYDEYLKKELLPLNVCVEQIDTDRSVGFGHFSPDDVSLSTTVTISLKLRLYEDSKEPDIKDKPWFTVTPITYGEVLLNEPVCLLNP